MAGYILVSHRTRRVLVGAWLLGVFGFAILGASADAAVLSAADLRDIARIETYLNRIKSVRGSFLQVSETGAVAEGRIYLQRPRQLRLDYKAPASLQIYANGYWLIFVDTELDEVTHVPLSSTPAYFLVREHVRLSGDVTVTRIERGRKTLRLHMVRSDEPEAGTVVLTLSDSPLSLRKWTVIDPQGARTVVSLVNPQFNVEIANEVFNFDETSFGRPNDP